MEHTFARRIISDSALLGPGLKMRLAQPHIRPTWAHSGDVVRSIPPLAMGPLARHRDHGAPGLRAVVGMLDESGGRTYALSA